MMGRRQTSPRRVVVLGASLAGMFAAAACAGGGRSVTVLERDLLPDAPEPRPGVPQGRQPHVLLYRGLLALQELLPGLGQELEDAGAVELDTGDLAWLGEEGWSPYGSPQYRIHSATRPLLEHLVRSRVRSLPGIVLHEGARVVSVRRGTGRSWEVVTDDGAVHEADLVVDATGRASRLTQWLGQAGAGPVAVSAVDARTGYATRVYAVPPGLIATSGIMLTQTPVLPMGGSVLPVEGGRWLVCAVGSGGHRPSRDAEAFTDFLRALPDPCLAEVVESSRPLSDVAVHRQTGNRRHHYERVRSWPAGLLVLGDALCAFNPVYGQGIAVAACQALLLRRAFDRGYRPGTERRLLRAFARLTRLPWGIATSQDLRLSSSDGSPTLTQELAGRWTREVVLLSAHGHARAQRTMARVYHLMAPARVLAHPALVAAVVRARVVGRGPANRRPPVVRPVATGLRPEGAQLEV
jgi:2-polyprenyl-6-methoxyphenol hydroxylase-like FAD-dependent oxidoreductase